MVLQRRPVGSAFLPQAGDACVSTCAGARLLGRFPPNVEVQNADVVRLRSKRPDTVYGKQTRQRVLSG